MSRKCWENYVFLLHVVHDELVNLMGGEASELQFSKSGPSVILLTGLQGVGKATVCELACYPKEGMLSVSDITMESLKEAKKNNVVVVRPLNAAGNFSFLYCIN